MKIIFNAFGFLSQKLQSKGYEWNNVELELEPNSTVKAVCKIFDLQENEVEAAFVNGEVKPLQTVLADGDRVALIPPGTPGPYRFLLGIKKVDPS